MPLLPPCGQKRSPALAGAIYQQGRGAFFMSLTACIVTLRVELSNSFLHRPRLRNQGTVNKRSTPPYQQLQMIARPSAASAGGGTALPFLLLPLYGRCFPLTCSAHGILPGRWRSAGSVSGPTGVRPHIPSLLFCRVVQGSFAPKRRFGTEGLWRYLFSQLLYHKKSEKREPCAFVKFARCWAVFTFGKQQAQHEGKKRTPANAGVFLSAASLGSGEKG